MSSRQGITRKSVDLTEAQLVALEAMIAKRQADASRAAGVEIKIGVREFFHSLLKKEAAELGVEWPDDYPTAGGWRGGPKSDDA